MEKAFIDDPHRYPHRYTELLSLPTSEFGKGNSNANENKSDCKLCSVEPSSQLWFSFKVLYDISLRRVK